MHLNVRFNGLKRHFGTTKYATKPSGSVEQMQRSKTSERKQTAIGQFFHLFLFVFILSFASCHERPTQPSDPVSKPSTPIEQYLLFLRWTDSIGVSDQRQLLAFIAEEDRHYSQFLEHMDEYEAMDLSELTLLTERICQGIYCQTILGVMDSTQVNPIMKRRAERRLENFFDKFNTTHNTH